MARQTYCKIVDGAIVAREPKDNPEVATGPDGNPVWRPEVGEAVDNSTGTDAVTERTEEIQTTRVYILTTTRDMTPQEIDDRNAARATSEAERLLGKIVKRLMATQFALINDVRQRHGQGTITAAQYLSFFDSSADGITDQQFVQKMKELLS